MNIACTKCKDIFLLPSPRCAAGRLSLTAGPTGLVRVETLAKAKKVWKNSSLQCAEAPPQCHSECTWASGPPKEMKIAVLVTLAQAGVHVRTEETGFPPSRKRLDGGDFRESEARNLALPVGVLRPQPRARFLSRDCGIGMTRLVDSSTPSNPFPRSGVRATFSRPSRDRVISCLTSFPGVS
jgi:hypothetical protein